MTPREHARLARELIAACGGLDEAAKACRVRRSVLSEYQNPHATSTMPADVIADLEADIGRAIYSMALFEAIGLPKAVAELGDAACDLTEAAAEVQAEVRQAIADGRESPRELDRIASDIDRVNAAADLLRASVSIAGKVVNLRGVR